MTFPLTKKTSGPKVLDQGEHRHAARQSLKTEKFLLRSSPRAIDYKYFMKTAKTRFLQNPHPPDLHIGVRDWLTQQDALGHHVYCLIDGALVGERSLRKLTRAGITWLSPVANNHLEAHEGLGLLLFDLQGPARQTALPLILEITNGVPTLQFISLHSEQRDHLPRLLTWLSEIHMGKGQAFYGRLADNRILSPMLSILSPLQNQVLGETIALWAWLDRTGRLEERTFPHVDRVPDILLDNGELRLGFSNIP